MFNHLSFSELAREATENNDALACEIVSRFDSEIVSHIEELNDQKDELKTALIDLYNEKIKAIESDFILTCAKDGTTFNELAQCVFDGVLHKINDDNDFLKYLLKICHYDNESQLEQITTDNFYKLVQLIIEKPGESIIKALEVGHDCGDSFDSICFGDCHIGTIDFELAGDITLSDLTCDNGFINEDCEIILELNDYYVTFSICPNFLNTVLTEVLK